MVDAPQTPETAGQLANRLFAESQQNQIAAPRPLSPAAQEVIRNAKPREVGTWEHIQNAAWPSIVQNTAGALNLLSYIGAPELQNDPVLKDIIPKAASAIFPKEMAFQPQGEVERATSFIADPTIALSPGRSLVTKLAEGAVGNAGAYLGDLAARKSGHPELELPAAVLGGMGGSSVRQIGTDVAGRMLTPKGSGEAGMLPGQLEALQKAGITSPSVGQIFNNDALLAREASTAAGAAIPSKQIADITAYGMKLAGSKSPVASIEAITNRSKELGPIFESAALQATGPMPNTITINGNNVRLSRALQDATQYMKDTHGVVPPILREINKAEMASFARGIPVDGKTLQAWRSQLSDWRLSNDQKLSDLGSKLLPIVDDVIYKNLPDDSARQALTKAKSQYSTLMDIYDSRSPTSVLGARGMIDPKALAATIASKKGLPSQSLPLAQTATAMNALPPMPNVPRAAWGPVRSVANTLGNLAGVAAMVPQLGNLAVQHLQVAPHWPPIAGAVAAGLTGANWLGHRLKSTAMQPNMQEMYSNALSGKSGMVRPMERIMGALSQPMQADDRQGRKSGGRVSNHDMEADQLVRAAERAKKGWSDATEPLLNQSDDAVAHALEVANRSI